MPADQWRVHRDEYRNFAIENQLEVFECSAFTGQNVDSLFRTLGQDVLLKNKNVLAEVGNSERSESVVLFANPPKEKKKWMRCC